MKEASPKRLINKYEKGEPVPVETHNCVPGSLGLSGRVVSIDHSGRPTYALCFDCNSLLEVNQSALEIYDMVKVTKSR